MKVTFNGSIKNKSDNSAVSEASGILTITKPDSSTQVISLLSKADGSFSVDALTFTLAGAYFAVANFSKSGYNDAVSNKVTFTVVANKDMVVTLNVVAA
jgi:hypothetical protein